MSFLGAAGAALPYAGVQLVVAGFSQAHSQLRRFSYGMQALNRDLMSISKPSERMAAALDVAGRAGFTLWTGASAAGAALIGLSVAAGTQAAQAETLSAATEAMAVAQARNLGEIEASVEAVREQSFTYAEAQEQVNKYATTTRDLAEVVRLAAVANDLAAVRGKDAVQVYDALTQAVVNGNAETLTTLGLGERAEVVLQREAEALGLKVDELSQAQRQTAVYNYIMERANSFSGAFASTTDTAARAVRGLRVTLNDVAIEFGQYLLPMFTSAVNAATDFLRTLRDLPPVVKRVLAEMTVAMGAIIGLTGAIGTAVIVINQMKSAAYALAGALSVMGVAGITAGGIISGFAAILALAAAAAGIYALAQENAKQKTEETVTEVELAFREMAAITALMSGLADLREKDSKPAGYRALEKDIERVREEIDRTQGAATGLEEALRNVERATWRLDDALQPYKDSLRRIEAQVTLLTVPWQRQLRQLRWQREETQELVDLEKARLDLHLEALQRQSEEIERLLALDRERLEVIDHTLFIEELRNKIIGREGSARALVLRSQKMAQEDLVSEREAELDDMREQIDLEKERTEALKEVADKQVEALDKQIAALEHMIAREEERATYAREELQMAEARQVEERIGLEAQERYLQRQQQGVSGTLSLQQRQLDVLEDKLEAYDDLLEKQKEYEQREAAILEILEKYLATMQEIDKIQRERNERRSEEHEEVLRPQPRPAPEPPVPSTTPSGTPTPPGGTPTLESTPTETPRPPMKTPEPPVPHPPTITPEPQKSETPQPYAGLWGGQIVDAVAGLFYPTGSKTTYNKGGTQINIDAHYNETQSPAQIADDVAFAAQLIA